VVEILQRKQKTEYGVCCNIGWNSSKHSLRERYEEISKTSSGFEKWAKHFPFNIEAIASRFLSDACLTISLAKLLEYPKFVFQNGTFRLRTSS
jgi:hypothetical protein